MNELSKAMLVAQPGPTSFCPQTLCFSPNTVTIALRVIYIYIFFIRHVSSSFNNLQSYSSKKKESRKV